uniref:chymotrypsin n=1 Tax=Labrus bergylta TaxID=56723 RepID=A0A3Q3GF38_9LABR
MALHKVICAATLLTFFNQECLGQLDVCGKPPLNNRIVGGQVAPQGSWPWQVSLHRSGFHFCGGSLINNQWVMSAAHCFQRTAASSLLVYLGRQSQEGTNSNEVSRSVMEIIVHPDYNAVTSDNDIALLKLSSTVTFTNFILPVCLAAPGSTFFSGIDAWVTGWGTIGSGAVVCGQASLNSRIMGGSSVTQAGVWPWMASLQKNGSHVCGGTLVALDSVLSNANCFSSSPTPSEWTVVLGRLKQNGSNPFEVTLNVTNITLSNLSGSNVAVLQLSTKPTLSVYIQPICLDNGQTFSEGSTCWAAGWSSGRGGEEQVLQELQTSIVNCGNTSSSDTICTASLTLEQGDSGGPLMCKLDGSWFQASVLSFENNSSTRGRVAKADLTVFTKLSSFQAFLTSTIGTFLSPASNGVDCPAHSSLFVLLHLLVLSVYLQLFA